VICLKTSFPLSVPLRHSLWYSRDVMETCFKFRFREGNRWESDEELTGVVEAEAE